MEALLIDASSTDSRIISRAKIEAGKGTAEILKSLGLRQTAPRKVKSFEGGGVVIELPRASALVIYVEP